MCRSASQGGRRCTGSGKSSTGAGGAVPTVATETAVPGVPTREQADQLAAKLPADRTGWDGKPLSEKDRRMYALRDSGYTGPIDQDGYPDTTSRAADVHRYLVEQRDESGDTVNIASGSDRVAMQVGQVISGSDETPPPVPPTPPTDTPIDEARTVNIRSGGAKVGIQAADVTGEINIWM